MTSSVPLMQPRNSLSSLVVAAPSYRLVSSSSPSTSWVESGTLSPNSVRSAAQEAFYRADSTRSGFLTLYEFRAAMRQLGFSLTDVSTISFFRAMDGDNQGKITLDQFVSWYSLNWKVLASMAVGGERREDGVTTISLFDRLAATEGENRALREEIVSLKTKLSDANSRAADADALSNRLVEATANAQAGRTQISELNKQIGSLSAEAMEASRLRSELSGTQDTLSAVRNDLHDANATAAGLRKRNADLEGKIQVAEAAAKQADKERLNALADREHALAEKRSLEVRVGAVETELTERLVQLENLQRVEREVSIRLEVVEKERDDARRELAELGNLLRHSENKLGNALLAEQMLSDKIVSHEVALKTTRELLNNSNANLDRTERSLVASQDNVSALRIDKQRLEKDNEGHKVALAERLAELQDLSRNFSAAQSRIATLEAQEDRLKRDLDVARDTQDRLQSNLSELQQRVPILEATIGDLQGKIAASDAVIPDLQRSYRHVAALERDLAELGAQAAAYRAALDSMHLFPDPSGVGVKIEESRGEIKVIGFIEDMSALRSGAIAVGDVVKAVEDKEVAGLSVQQVRDLILGPRGSYVSVTFIRASNKEKYTVQLRRGSSGPEFHSTSESRDSNGPRTSETVFQRFIGNHFVTM